jgi:single-stranded-DNA-specific exonuclease
MQRKWQIAKREHKDLKRHLLAMRGLSEEDLKPKSPKEILPELFALFPQVEEAVRLIIKAAGEERAIVIHGDYDADGICATALLWEALYYNLGYKNTHPFIPNRFDHGYGLSGESLQEVAEKYPKALIVTVDCGITAAKEVEKAKERGLEVIITDHHQPPENLPKAHAILWTDKLAGASIAWVLGSALRARSEATSRESGLDLLALATIADIQPLTGSNRVLVKAGLKQLNTTSRLGLQELYKASGLSGKKITPFEVGWVLAPRINASGRLKDAKEALRLLVTKSKTQAFEIASVLDTTNRERQKLTLEQYELAKQQVLCTQEIPNILWVKSGEFHEGVIGLVAGKLAQEFYRPAVVLAASKEELKASARSIPGVDIIEILRRLEHLSCSMGGHSGAAGFSLLPDQVEEFEKLLLKEGEAIDKELFAKKLFIDALVKPSEVDMDLLTFFQDLGPFGEGNPAPRLALEKVQVQDYALLGSENSHLKMVVKSEGGIFTALWFSYPPEFLSVLERGSALDLAFTLRENSYNGKKELQLILKHAKNS